MLPNHALLFVGWSLVKMKNTWKSHQHHHRKTNRFFDDLLVASGDFENSKLVNFSFFRLAVVLRVQTKKVCVIRTFVPAWTGEKVRL